VPEGEGQLL